MFDNDDRIDILNLSVRAYRALTDEGINTVGELIKIDFKSKIPGIGLKSMANIKDALSEYQASNDNHSKIKLNGLNLDQYIRLQIDEAVKKEFNKYLRNLFEYMQKE